MRVGPTASGQRPRVNNRHAQLVDAAAHVFRQKGYGLTTMRDIAAATGMTAGSIYYHYPSKSDLLLAVYTEGVRRAGSALRAAVESVSEPWDQLECAVTAHLTMMVGGDSDAAPFAGVFVQVMPHDFPPEHVRTLIALRNEYEEHFRDLIEQLPLRRGVDRTLLRLHLIGALNHVPHWYRRDGRASPQAIARAMIRYLRYPVDREDGVAEER